MLITRIISAIVMLFLLAMVILYLPKQQFIWLELLIAFGLAMEWSGLVKGISKVQRYLYAIMISGISFLCINYLSLNTYIIGVVVFLWCASFALLLYKQNIALLYKLKLIMPLGVIYITSFAWVFYDLFPKILPLVLLVAIVDVGAYFSGRAIGKRKLAPQISPNKTWEGCFGGALLLYIVACIIWLQSAIFNFYELIALFILVVLLAFVSICGDLLESGMKRYIGKKDSGAIIPGHGGLFDRMDALIAVAPVYWLILQVIPEISSYLQ